MEEWFTRRTWRAGEFRADELVNLADAAGVRVSVVIPALDEAATVGRVVAAASVPGLVAEVVVVDGGSDDGTIEVAAGAGARVISQGRADPGAPGKGDALWRGLAETTGDLVVFMDADVHDPDERSVLGLVGPLLTDRDVVLIKAAYDRPLHRGDRVHASEGGRVTALLARPLLAIFWPDLAGVTQPLAGEYAGRREVLEAVPFVTGYGVELGLLLEVAALAGPDAIGQVDLGSRRHDHQPLPALARMATEILAVAADRLEAEGRLHGERGDVLLQPARRDGRLSLDRVGVQVRRRPPLRPRPG